MDFKTRPAFFVWNLAGGRESWGHCAPCGWVYVRVKTPHIAKEKMYLTSWHLPVLYAESMFPPMEMDEHHEERKKFKNESRNWKECCWNMPKHWLENETW
jgi:hypothetical protein